VALNPTGARWFQRRPPLVARFCIIAAYSESLARSVALAGPTSTEAPVPLVPSLGRRRWQVASQGAFVAYGK
jgi:hypothetical protein